MRTKQAHSPTKEKLLGAAQEVMLEKGFPSTTVEDICEKAGVTKGSFFHYFVSKEALGKEALEYYISQSQRDLQAAAFHQKKDPLQRINGYIDYLVQKSQEAVFEKGCLLGIFSQELSSTYPEIRSLCARKFEEWAEILKADMDQAREKYVPKKPINTLSLAEHFIATLEGSLILAKAKQDKRIVEKSLEHFRKYLQTLFEG